MGNWQFVEYHGAARNPLAAIRRRRRCNHERGEARGTARHFMAVQVIGMQTVLQNLDFRQMSKTNIHQRFLLNSNSIMLESS